MRVVTFEQILRDTRPLIIVLHFCTQIAPGKEFSIPEGGVLVIEGIHALNPQCVCCQR